MAALSPPSARVETSAGVPISGGKLRVRNVNTTTLSSLYSDEAMTTPLTNPVTADSNGFLPSIFVDEGSYDIAYLDASSALLTGQSYDDFPTFTSSGAGTISRTLSGARVVIDGGDIGDGTTGVRVNAGNPAPDDTGGYLRLGGYDGTVADKIIFDGNTVEVLEPKSLKEDGKRLSGLLMTDATSFSAASSVAVALTNDPTGTRCFRVTFYDLIFSSAVAVIQLRLAYDGVPTFKSGASDYGYAYTSNSGAGLVEGGDDADARIALFATSASSTSHPLIIDFHLLTPNSGNGDTNLWGKVLGLSAGSAFPRNVTFEAEGLGNYGRATHVGLIPSTGTVSGKYRVEQLRGFGE